VFLKIKQKNISRKAANNAVFFIFKNFLIYFFIFCSERYFKNDYILSKKNKAKFRGKEEKQF